MVNSETTLPALDVALIGATHTGKSTLIERYIALLSNPSRNIAEGEDARAHILAVDARRLTVWDMVGQGRYHRMHDGMLRQVDVFALVYDVSAPSTFFDLMYLRDTVMGIAHRARLIVIGNKIDLPSIVPSEEARGWAEGLNMPFLTTSALTGEGVLAFFDLLVSEAGRERQRRIAR